jgi:hypothetical protein
MCLYEEHIQEVLTVLYCSITCQHHLICYIDLTEDSVTPVSHLISCTPTKYKSYFDSCFTTVMSKPVPCTKLHVQLPLFKETVQVSGHSQSFTRAFFYDEYFIAPHPTFNLEDHSLSAVNIPYILESNPHLVFATFLNEKKLVHRLYHFSKIRL